MSLGCACACITDSEACLAAVTNWMSGNVLLLNSDKTEMLVIGRLRHQFDHVTVTLHNCVISQCLIKKNLELEETELQGK